MHSSSTPRRHTRWLLAALLLLVALGGCRATASPLAVNATSTAAPPTATTETGYIEPTTDPRTSPPPIVPTEEAAVDPTPEPGTALTVTPLPIDLTLTILHTGQVHGEARPCG